MRRMIMKADSASHIVHRISIQSQANLSTCARLSLSLSLCLSVCLSVCLSALSLSVSLCLCLSLSLSVCLSVSVSLSLELGQSEKSILLGNFSRRGRHAGEHTRSTCGAAHADMKVSDVLAGAAASDLLGAPSPLLAAPSSLLAAPSSLLAAARRMLTRALRPRP